jgi:hypothetical protein
VHAVCAACLRVFPVLLDEGAEPWEPSADDWRSSDDRTDATGAPPPEAATATVEEIAERAPAEELAPLEELAEAPPIAEAPEPVVEPPPSEFSTAAELEVQSTPAPEPPAELPQGRPEASAPAHPGRSSAAPGVAPGAERFGHRDPHERARHLARVLVSDIIAYYPVKYRESFDRGTLQEDFKAEVERSWKEFVDQVGAELARETTYFRDALTQVLGKGKHHF